MANERDLCAADQAVASPATGGVGGASTGSPHGLALQQQLTDQSHMTSQVGLTDKDRFYVRLRLDNKEPLEAWSLAYEADPDECPVAQRVRAMEDIRRLEPLVYTSGRVMGEQVTTMAGTRERLLRAYRVAHMSADAGAMARIAMNLAQLDGLVKQDGSGVGAGGGGASVQIDVRFVPVSGAMPVARVRSGASRDEDRTVDMEDA